MDLVHKQANVEEPLGLLLSQSGSGMFTVYIRFLFTQSQSALHFATRCIIFHSPAQMNSLFSKYLQTASCTQSLVG